MIMSFDEISNTSLGLGLGLGLHEHHHQAENCMKKKEENYYDPSKCNINKAYPILSLTLGPKIIDDDQQQEASKIELASSNNYSPSAVSNSFSNSSSIIMKEKDQFLGEEFEVDEKIPSSRSRDVDDIIIEDGNPRKKLRLSKEQSTILEENFKEHSTLNPKQKQELAKKLNLRARQVEVWFQNRRARTKLKQTESECELLRKCCETLTEENKRLQKELQQLRSTQTTTTAVPFYMHIPSAATLTICPSCEGKLICGDANNNIINYNNASSSSSPKNTTSTTFLIAASSNPHTHNNNHFYKNNNYPFSHSSSSSMLAS